MIEHGPDGEVVAGALTVPDEPPASAPASTRTAAFFDVDNTVLRGASIFHMAKGLWKRGFFTGRDIAAMLWKQVHFALVGENLAHVAKIREQALTFVAGHTVDEIERIGEEVYDEVMADKIWPGTRALAQSHLESGHDVWLVTASPVEVATVIASRLGLTGALGTVAESVDGVYTGRLVGDPLHGASKAVAVEALSDQRGYELELCSAYSDSAFGRGLDTTRMREVLGFEPEYTTRTAFEDFARGIGSVLPGTSALNSAVSGVAGTAAHAIGHVWASGRND